MLMPVGELFASIGRASRRHSCSEYPDQLIGLTTMRPWTLPSLTLMGRLLSMMTLTKKAISPLVERGILRVRPSSPAVIRGGSAVLMVAIILHRNGFRTVSHYTRVLVSSIGSNMYLRSTVKVYFVVALTRKYRKC